MMRQTSVSLQWLPGEHVALHLRRHWILLVGRLLPPIIVLLAPVFLILLSLATRGANPAQAEAVINLSTRLILLMIVPLALWAAYNGYDWANDAFIITNMRVIRAEKGVLAGQEQDQAPLESILDVASAADGPLGLRLDYGSVTMQTAARVIVFDGIAHPSAVEDAIVQLLRATRPGGQAPPTPEPGQETTPPQHPAQPQQPTPAQPPKRSGGRFRLLPTNPEIDADGTITWRKHAILLGTAITPALLLLIICVVLWLITRWTALFLPLSLIAVLAMIFEYVNWANDIYILTHDKIVDIDRVPLIKMDRREAFLEQIQDVRLAQPNLWYRILNVGNVVIETAGQGAFTFDAVPNPAWVQEQIMSRKRENRQSDRQHDVIQIVENIMRKQYESPAPPPGEGASPRQR